MRNPASASSSPGALRRRAFHLVVAVGSLIVLTVAFLAHQIFLAPFWLEPVPLVISRETTYLTEPLGPDGTIDYVAFVQPFRGHPVPPEDNFFAGLVELAGPEVLGSYATPEVLASIGDPKLLAEGDRFSGFEESLLGSDQPPALGSDTRAPRAVFERAWGADEFPDVARWLERNQRARERLMELTHRPSAYLPLPSTKGLEWSSLTGDIKSLTNLARAHGWNSLAEGRKTDAAEDAITLLRFGEQLPKGEDRLVGQVMAVAIQRSGFELVDRICLDGGIESESLRILAERVESTPTPCGLRAAMLNRRLTTLETLALSYDPARAESAPQAEHPLPGGLRMIDVNVVLRRINALFDDIDAAIDPANRRTQRDVLAALQDDLELRAHPELTRAQLAWRSLLRTPSGRREFASRLVGDMLASLIGPTLILSFNRFDLLEAHRQITRTTIALVRYRVAERHYPETIAEVVPRFLPEVPADPFDGAPLRYRVTGDSFVLYSVGPNATDDGGIDPARDFIAGKAFVGTTTTNRE